MGKIRGALKTNQPVEGAIYAPECQAVENGTVDDIIITDCSNIFRDLSSWRVSIPSSDTLQVITSDFTYYCKPSCCSNCCINKSNVELHFNDFFFKVKITNSQRTAKIK